MRYFVCIKIILNIKWEECVKFKKNILIAASLFLLAGINFAVFSHDSAKLQQATLKSNTIDYSKMSAAELDAAFVTAVKERHLETIQKLIQAGANVNTPISYIWTAGDCDWNIENTALIYAVRHNCPNIVKELLKVKHKLNENLNEALKEAIKEGYSDVVKELVEAGVDINYKDINENEDTPLILSIKHARSSAEFSPQAQMKHKSRWRQRRRVILILLKAGANVNCVNKYGRTALMEAVIEHDLNTVLELLKVPEINIGSFFGFKTKPKNYADQDGNTALIHAVKNVHCNYITNQEYNICKKSQAIVEALFKSPGINPHHVNNNGETAISLLEKLKKKA